MRPWLLLLATALELAACKAEQLPSVELTLGGSHHLLEPRVAFAEYLELPGTRTELKITLASYRASCDRFVPPSPGEMAVTVVVVVPPGQTLGPGVYPWNGVTVGEPSQLPAQPFSVPKAFIGQEGHVFRPGGSVQLTRVVLEPNGSVEGMLAFDFGGDGSSPATSLKGAFRARFCRLEPAERGPAHEQPGAKPKGSAERTGASR